MTTMRSPILVGIIAFSIRTFSSKIFELVYG
jgi:hypothetical protein